MIGQGIGSPPQRQMMPMQTTMNPVGGAAEPYMRLVPNQELDARDELARRDPLESLLPPLTAHISRLWEAAKRAKEPIQRKILADYRQRKGEYDPEILAEIQQQGGSAIYMMLTALKCRALEAWITDVIMPPDDRAWDIEPTPVSDLPPAMEAEVEQAIMSEAKAALGMFGQLDMEAVKDRIDELRDAMRDKAQAKAEKAATRMADQIEDALTEGNWQTAMSEVLYDFVTTRACVVHGPVMRRKKTLRWEEDSETGHFTAVEDEVVQKHYERVNPLDAYPSPDSAGIDDGYFFHHQRMSPGEIYAMKGVEGFRDAEIDTVLEEFSMGGLRNWMFHDIERARIENKDMSLLENTERRIDTLVYNGPVAGRLLHQWGLPVNDTHEDIECRIWLIGRYVIGVRLNNAPGGKRPYAKASLEEIPGAFWGNGLSYILLDMQGMCNAAGRAIANNMGISSGPQVVINDTSRLPPNENVTSLYPWKIWQFGPDKTATSNRPPVDFFQPTGLTAELIAVYDKFSGMADEFVPSYMSGNQEASGAGKTASGLSMLMSQATKTVKKAILNLDQGVVNRIVYMTYLQEMLYNPDPTIKGDLTVVARGAVSLLVKEQQQIRRNEFLQSTMNEYDMQIMGLPGRANVLREVAKSLDIPVDDVVPDQESIKAMANEQLVQQAVQQQVAQIIQQLATTMGVKPEQLLQLLQQPQQQGGGGQPQMAHQAGRTLDVAGNPVGGQDTRLFG